MENWDEIRTAYQVARSGTVSAAADILGVHHATVIRHIDSLEKQLGTKLFQRHARGYTPTEAGRDLLKVAQETSEQFNQLVSRIKGQGEIVSGELIITAIHVIADLIAPVLKNFQTDHPDVTIRFLTGLRVFRLDHGEAHIALRAGTQPQKPDYVVQPLTRLRYGLYAAQDYVDQYGIPQTIDDFTHHRFIGFDDPDARAPFHTWMREHVPQQNILFRTNGFWDQYEAIKAGIGIGFYPARLAKSHFVEIMPPQDEWDTPVWIVTHVDLHRTLKVQSFLQLLRSAAKNWS